MNRLSACRDVSSWQPIRTASNRTPPTPRWIQRVRVALSGRLPVIWRSSERASERVKTSSVRTRVTAASAAALVSAVAITNTPRVERSANAADCNACCAWEYVLAFGRFSDLAGLSGTSAGVALSGQTQGIAECRTQMIALKPRNNESCRRRYKHSATSRQNLHCDGPTMWRRSS